MRDYVQMARHLASCIITHPMDMYTQVNVFVDGMREGLTRLSARSLPHWRRHLALPSVRTLEYKGLYQAFGCYRRPALWPYGDRRDRVVGWPTTCDSL